MLTKWLAIALLLTVALSVDCNATAYEFLSEYSLGKQDELNITFDKIIKKIPTIPDSVYPYSDRINYTTTNFSYTFKYLDSTQKSEIVGRDQIIVKDGRLRVDFTLNWTETGSVTKGGYAIGYGLSDPIIFTKNMKRTGDNLVMYNLVDYENVTFSHAPFNLTRMEPYADDDFAILNLLVNHLINVTTCKDYLTEGINNYLSSNLNDSLHDNKHTLDKNIKYTYRDPFKGNQSITFDHTLVTVDLDQLGIDYYYVTIISNFADFRCGAPVPAEPLDTRYFGGTQEFLSLGVHESSVLFAIRNGFLNTDLTQARWPSSVFQFYAGDLYDVIPTLSKKFYPSDSISGSCNAIEQGFSLVRGGPTYLNVTINFNCTLGIGKSKINDFTVNTIWQIEGRPSNKYIDFVVMNVYSKAVYSTYQ